MSELKCTIWAIMIKLVLSARWSAVRIFTSWYSVAAIQQQLREEDVIASYQEAAEKQSNYILSSSYSSHAHPVYYINSGIQIISIETFAVTDNYLFFYQLTHHKNVKDKGD